jgi:hypothetical protein
MIDLIIGGALCAGLKALSNCEKRYEKKPPTCSCGGKLKDCGRDWNAMNDGDIYTLYECKKCKKMSSINNNFL